MTHLLEFFMLGLKFFFRSIALTFDLFRDRFVLKSATVGKAIRFA